MNSNPPYDLVRWETPFTDKLYPSILVVPHPGGPFSLVVAPKGIDSYPKYLIEFDDMVAYKCEDEGFAPTKLILSLSRDCIASAYMWIGSPWLKEWDEEQSRLLLAAAHYPFPRHYLLLGGDNIVEVLVGGEPVINPITEPTTVLTIKV